MLIAKAPKIAEMAKADDPKQGILKAIGDIGPYEVLGDLVLVGTFVRNEVIRGIIRPDVEDDEHQGKVGLVLMRGPYAYADWEPVDERGDSARLGTWVVFARYASWPLQINGAPCRLVPYDKLRMRISDPNLVF